MRRFTEALVVSEAELLALWFGRSLNIVETHQP
jgi:hypothetical protein